MVVLSFNLRSVCYNLNNYVESVAEALLEVWSILSWKISDPFTSFRSRETYNVKEKLCRYLRLNTKGNCNLKLKF